MRINPRQAAAAVCLTVATLLVFHPGLTGGFVFDDFPNLVRAEGWKAASLELSVLMDAMRSGQTSEGGRPLAMLSFAVNHALTGLAPWWLKATSLLLHLVNGLLAWRLLRHMLAAGSRAQGELAALLIAGAWLVHPLQASTVLYVVQRMEIGAATGVLWSLLAYVRLRQAQLAGRPAWPWTLTSITGLVFGLGFKEAAAITPVLALLLEAALFRFRRANGAISRGLLGAYGLLLLGGTLLFLHIMLPITSAAAYAARDFDASERLLTQGPVLLMYVKQALLPLPDTFRFYYDAFPVSKTLFEPRAFVAWALLAVTAVLAIAVRRRWPLTALGIAWFFACHAITSSPIPLELAFEHRNYLALLGLLLALAPPLQALGRFLHADARRVLAVLPVLALALLGNLVASTWGDPLRLAWALENRGPDSPRATYALASQLFDLSEGDRQSPTWAMGMALLERARHLPTASALPVQALIVMRGRYGQEVEPALWADFRERLTRHAIAPAGVEALYAVSNCRIAGRCQLDDGELLATFLAVLRANPDNSTVHTLYADFAWNVLDDAELALSLQRAAVRLAPNVETRVALAKFLLASSEPTSQSEGARLADQLEAEGLAARFSRELDALKRPDGHQPD